MLNLKNNEDYETSDLFLHFLRYLRDNDKL